MFEILPFRSLLLIDLLPTFRSIGAHFHSAGWVRRISTIGGYWAVLTVLSSFSISAYSQPTSGISAAQELAIAVMSPRESGEPELDRVGEDHSASANASLGLENGRIEIGERTYVMSVHDLSGPPSPSECRRRAERAVRELKAVAIVGPVTSTCTRAVLEAGLDIPVLTSLATAPQLNTVQGNEWLFRTIANDRHRLSQYVQTVDASALERGIALYENSDYGEGLRDEVLAQADIEDDVHHTYAWDDIVDEANSTHDQVTLAEDFRSEIQEHEHEHDIPTVFVLGSKHAVPITLELFELFRSVSSAPNYVLVSLTKGADKLPAGTRIIGELRADESTDLISSFSEGRPPDELEKLYVSTLDAGLALRQALAKVLGEESSDVDPVTRRMALRDALATGRFRSSERFRTIEFNAGEVSDPPITPIYQISAQEVRSISAINTPEPKSWVEIEVVHQPRHHWEGPLVVELIPHGEELIGQSVTLQADGLGPSPVTIAKLDLQKEGSRVAFVPEFWTAPFPRRVILSTSPNLLEQTVVVGEFGWPVSYLVAALFALMATALFTRSLNRGQDKENRGRRFFEVVALKSYAERCVAGVVIAFLILHVGPLLDPPGIEAHSIFAELPIPRFESSWWVNAAVSGLLGGWLGLKFIVGLAAATISSLAPLFHQGEQ